MLIIAILSFIWVFMWMAKDDAFLRKILFFAHFIVALMVYKNLSHYDIYASLLVALVATGFILAIAGLVFLPYFDGSDLVKMTRKMLILTLILGATSIAARVAQSYIANLSA